MKKDFINLNFRVAVFADEKILRVKSSHNSVLQTSLKEKPSSVL